MNATVLKAAPPDRPSASSCTTVATPRGSFWSRHKTLINFWLDLLLLILFLTQAWLLTVVVVVFPPGDSRATIWGATAAEWLGGLFATSCVFAVAVLLHVMLHWTWICGTVATRLLGRKPGRDDGSQTLIGVALLIALLHVFGAAVLAARVYLVPAS
uniref:DUF4405 domain-containing protein n=1 Tax=Schlesneria paludicola TaxID=360056 RepID=A0A7C2JYG5_9PLAN